MSVLFRLEKAGIFPCLFLCADPYVHCRCLVAIVEHLIPKDYYSKTLIASQADQRVLRDLLAEKLPRLSAHFDALKYVMISLVLRIWCYMKAVSVCVTMSRYCN